MSIKNNESPTGNEGFFNHFKDGELRYSEKGSIILNGICKRLNNQGNNRCINCGAKSGHKCELDND